MTDACISPIVVSDSSNASWFGRYRLSSRIATGGMAERTSACGWPTQVLGAWTRHNEDARSLAELGFVRYRQEKLDDAAALLRRALRQDKELALAHYDLGAVLFRQHNISGAGRAYRESDRLEPKDPRALAALCQVLAQVGRVNDGDARKRSLPARFPKKAKPLADACAPAP